MTTVEWCLLALIAASFFGHLFAGIGTTWRMCKLTDRVEALENAAWESDRWRPTDFRPVLVPADDELDD